MPRTNYDHLSEVCADELTESETKALQEDLNFWLIHHDHLQLFDLAKTMYQLGRQVQARKDGTL